MEDINKYELLKSSGCDPRSVYLEARNDGHDLVARVRILRAVFGLTLREAKKIGFEADSGKTLESQEQALVDDFVRVIDEELGHERGHPKAED